MTIKRKKSNAVKALDKIIGQPSSFSSLLLSIRKGDELSQTEFAALLGISQQHLCDIEKGRKGVSAARASEFALTLGYSEKHFVRQALQDEVEKAGLNLRVDVA